MRLRQTPILGGIVCFDLTDLRLLLHIIEANSITAGVERARLTLVSVSTRIRKVEDAFNVLLLTRNRRGMETTAADHILVRHAHTVLRQMDRTRGELGEYARGLKGCVRPLSDTAAVTEFLPETLSTFPAIHPEIDIGLEELTGYKIVEATTRGCADIGIVDDTVDLPGLEAFPFHRDRIMLVITCDHPLARHRELTFVEALQGDFVSLTSGNALQTYPAGRAARAGHRPRYHVHLRSFDAVCCMVGHNASMGITLEHAATRLQRSMGTRRVCLADTQATRLLCTYVRHFDNLPVSTRQLIEHLHEAWTRSASII